MVDRRVGVQTNSFVRIGSRLQLRMHSEAAHVEQMRRRSQVAVVGAMPASVVVALALDLGSVRRDEMDVIEDSLSFTVASYVVKLSEVRGTSECGRSVDSVRCWRLQAHGTL